MTAVYLVSVRAGEMFVLDRICNFVTMPHYGEMADVEGHQMTD